MGAVDSNMSFILPPPFCAKGSAYMYMVGFPGGVHGAPVRLLSTPTFTKNFQLRTTLLLSRERSDGLHHSIGTKVYPAK